MCVYVSSEEAEQTKRKRKICLVLPGYFQKLKKSIDFLKKIYILKIGIRSARFKRFLQNKKYICPRPGRTGKAHKITTWVMNNKKEYRQYMCRPA